MLRQILKCHKLDFNILTKAVVAKCHGVAQIITVAIELVGVSSLLWVTPVQNESMGTMQYNCKASGTVHIMSMVLLKHKFLMQHICIIS